MWSSDLRAAFRKLVSVRVTPSVFLLVAGYLCLYATSTAAIPDAIGNLLFFGASWLLPLIACLFSTYLFFRHLSLQHIVEVAVGVWLITEAIDRAFRFTHA